jgi:hypothetical protein
LLLTQRLTRLLLLTPAAVLSLAAPAAARVTAGDAAATHAYLQATIARDRADSNDFPGLLATLAALEVQVKSECPNILVGAPPHVKGEKTNESEEQITSELLSATLGRSDVVEHHEDVRFEKIVGRLRWSSRKLTKLLRSLALEAAEQSAIPPPDLCADLHYWVTSGYNFVSPGTKSYLHRLDVVSSITFIEQEPGEPVGNFLHPNALIAYRLRRYEDHADRLLARTALPPETKLVTELIIPSVMQLFEAAGRVLAALGRTPAPAAPVPAAQPPTA